MKVKKFLCIMSLALIISLSSCNKNKANNSSLTSDTSTETSKVIISEEDDISIIDSKPDNSSASTPDDSSNISDSDNTSADFMPDDSSNTTEPGSSIDIPSINANSLISDILKAILSNDNVNSFNGIMKNFIRDYLNGQDTLYIREFSSVSSRLFDLSISDTSVIDSAICVEPYEGPIEYCCYLIKLNEGTEKEKIKSEIFSSLDKNRWGCITAEKAIVIDSGNIILALMASDAETAAYTQAFQEVMGTAGTVLSK